MDNTSGAADCWNIKNRWSIIQLPFAFNLLHGFSASDFSRSIFLKKKMERGVWHTMLRSKMPFTDVDKIPSGYGGTGLVIYTVCTWTLWCSQNDGLRAVKIAVRPRHGSKCPEIAANRVSNLRSSLWLCSYYAKKAKFSDTQNSWR